MGGIYSRTKILIGENSFEKLQRTHIAILGLGGVGSYTTEALARTGVGKLTIIDHDNIDITNLNRQIHALHSTIGQPKIKVMQERIKDINPSVKVIGKDIFINDKNISNTLTGDYDYIIDAIDTVSSKLTLIEYALNKNIPIISCMGTANRLINTNFKVDDISKTSYCPLAKIIRKELRKKGIYKGLKVVYSQDLPLKANGNILGSIAFVPPVAGLIMAGQVINDLLNI